jgi:hypothetical protein
MIYIGHARSLLVNVSESQLHLGWLSCRKPCQFSNVIFAVEQWVRGDFRDLNSRLFVGVGSQNRKTNNLKRRVLERQAPFVSALTRRSTSPAKARGQKRKSPRALSFSRSHTGALPHCITSCILE